MRIRIISIALFLLVLNLPLPPLAQIRLGHNMLLVNTASASISVTTFEELKTAVTGATQGTVIEILDSFTLTEPLVIRATATINGNGHTLTRGPSMTSYCFEVNYRGSATFNNITIDGANVVCTQPCIYVHGGNLVMNDSTITRNNRTGSAGTFGGGISMYLQTSYLTLNNTTISDCHTKNEPTSGGGGLFADEFTRLVMNASSITDCSTGGHGGGVYVKQGRAGLTNGCVLARNSAGLNGGGMYISTSDTVTFTGGSIVNNSAQGNGGGFYTSGMEDISNSISSHFDTLTLDGVTLSGNSAGEKGGGGFFAPYGKGSLSNTSFSDNTATNTASGQGLAVSDPGYVTLGGTQDWGTNQTLFEDMSQTGVSYVGVTSEISLIDKRIEVASPNYTAGQVLVRYTSPLSPDPTHFASHGAGYFTTASGTDVVLTQTQPTLTGNVTIAGNALYYDTITAQVSGMPRDAVAAYQWFCGTTQISGATGQSYAICSQDDVGAALTCKVSDSSGRYAGFISARTSPIPTPNISATVELVVPSTITAAGSVATPVCEIVNTSPFPIFLTRVTVMPDTTCDLFVDIGKIRYLLATNTKDAIALSGLPPTTIPNTRLAPANGTCTLRWIIDIGEAGYLYQAGAVPFATIQYTVSYKAA